MEITKHNFPIDLFRQKVQECEFLAYDAEFSGLNFSEHDRRN